MEKMKNKAIIYSAHEQIDIIANGDVVLGYKDGNKRHPCLLISPGFMETLVAPWNQSVVVKLLGKNISFRMFSTRIQAMSKPKDEFDILDLGFDYYLLRLDDRDDWENALTGRPWVI